MNDARPVILLVEGDIVARTPLAEYLRGCGFNVLEASSGDEAVALLSGVDRAIEAVLADMQTPGGGFPLRQWIREHRPLVEVVLAGSVDQAVNQAGRLCNDGPALAKPYEHHLVLDHIRRALARRKPG